VPVIRWGPQTASDKLRQCARCTACGNPPRLGRRRYRLPTISHRKDLGKGQRQHSPCFNPCRRRQSFLWLWLSQHRREALHSARSNRLGLITADVNFDFLTVEPFHTRSPSSGRSLYRLDQIALVFDDSHRALPCVFPVPSCGRLAFHFPRALETTNPGIPSRSGRRLLKARCLQFPLADGPIAYPEVLDRVSGQLGLLAQP
jgi:hypothetical protein